MRVVIAEDSLLLREGLVALLREHDVEVVAQAEDGEGLLRIVGGHKPDLAIVDVRLRPTFTDEGIRAAVEGVCQALGGRGSEIERRVRAYTQRDAPGQGIAAITPPPSTLSVPEAEVIAIFAANELDMHMSGEIRYCGRTDVIAAGDMAQIRHVCETLAIDGLYRSLVREQALEIPVPRECLTGLRESYRIGRDRRSAVRMATNVPALLP